MTKPRKKKLTPPGYSEYGYYWSSNLRDKTDWLGIQIGDCYKNALDYLIRLTAKSKYYSYLNRTLKQMASIAGISDQNLINNKPKAQLDPFFTNYPAQFAAYASIGLTAFLYYQNLRKKDGINAFFDKAEQIAAGFDPYTEYDRKILVEFVKVVVDAIYTRICMSELSREYQMQEIEIYRLFAASQVDRKLRLVSDIIRTVILYGDLIVWHKEEMHPMTHAIYRDMKEASFPYYKLFICDESCNMITEGIIWTREIMDKLKWLLPYAEDKEGQEKQVGLPKNVFRYARSEAAEYSEDFPPLNEPAPPFLDEPKSIDELVARAFKQSSKQDLSEENKKFIGRTLSFFEAARTASGKGEDWHDMRSDLMESAHKGFKQSTIQGDHREGNMIEIKLLNSDTPIRAEVYDTTLPPMEDPEFVDQLLSQAQPLIDEMKMQIFPCFAQIPITEKFKTSGSIDPARLSSTDFSESFFRRYRIENKPEPRGRPVLVILNDGSASMGRKETKMLKLLTTAWVESTKRMELQILVGIYNYVHISPAIHGNVMTWVYHPNKTVHFNRSEAINAIAAMPENGAGGQSDALALAYMMQEARKLAKDRMIYLVHITDGGFCGSFPSPKSAMEEVTEMYETLYDQCKDKLHVTVVGLNRVQPLLQDVVDKVITIAGDELRDTEKATRKIADYILETLRERKKKIKRR